MENVVNTVKERATAQLDSQKGRATAGLDAITHAVRQTTQQLRTDQHDTMAQFIEGMADQLERFSSTMRNKSVDELLRDAQQLARRQPALFIGGSFAAGLLAARFLKSSQRGDGYSSGAGYSGSGYGSSGYGGSGYEGSGYGGSGYTGDRGEYYTSAAVPAERIVGEAVADATPREPRQTGWTYPADQGRS